jgi:SAM-dependent methyltransferase
VEGNLEDPDEPGSAIGAERNEPLGLFALPYAEPGGLKAAVRPAQRRVEASGLMQVAPRAAVNLADHDASFKGLAVLPSRIAIETLMKSLGFSVSRVLLKEHPTKNEDVATYTGPRKYQALSKRYFLRCFRETKINAPTLSLESLVLAEDQSKTESWQSTTNWFSFNGTKNSGVIVSDLGTSEEELTSFRGSHEARMDPTGKWEFDATIAQRFEREARCHIPDYEEVVDDAIRILERELQEKSLQKGEVKALDVGCATGHTIIRMLQQGFHNVHGVDLSSDMLSRARERLKEAGFEHASASNVHLSTSPLDLPERLIDGGKFDAVFVNWTLQFVVDETERKLFLQNIGKRMASGALIVLTEKTVQNKETKDAYYAFKRRMGVSEREIVHKEERLKGVLEPLSTQWYLDALSDCGFTRVSVFRAKYGFVTFVARRGGAHIENDSMAQPPLPPGDFQTWNLSASADNIQHDAKEELAPFSTRAWGSSTANSWVGGSKNGTVYGYVHEGPTTLTVIGSKDRSFTLWDGMYFASAGSIKVKGGSGVLQLVDDHRALFAIGGPVEEVGRLPYIDGCTDTLLLAPAIKGAPCLNHLHFPANVIQTQHTHPSGRSGVVVSGRGACVCQGGKVRTPLAPGVAFVIPANVLHAFETEDQELDVVAFHPDSDSGPTADDHPMVNRTMVDGVSASQIDSIRTKDTQAGLE